MEDKTSQSNATALAEAYVALLENAKVSGGILVNATRKSAPVFYNKTQAIRPLDSLLIAFASDKADYKTNAVMLFMDAKKTNLAIKGGEHGVPFSWFSSKEFQNKENPEEKISREKYLELPKEEQAKFSAIKTREMVRVYNIDQTTLPDVDKEAYMEAVHTLGAPEEKDAKANDMATRISFNNYIKALKENLLPIRKDGEGVAAYDVKADVIHLPAQSSFPSYEDYVQETNRLILTATGHSQRLDRKGMDMQTIDVEPKRASLERLVVELASAAKQLQFGLPAKLSKESMPLVDEWIDTLKEKPGIIYAVEKDVNQSLSMVAKAASGKKVELKSEAALRNLTKETAKIDNAFTALEKYKVVKVPEGKDGKLLHAMYFKPEGADGFAVIPEKNDVDMFYNTINKVSKEKENAMMLSLANKYGHAEAGTYRQIDLFNDNPKGKNRVSDVHVFPEKKDPKKYMLVATIDGEKHYRTLSNSEASLFFLAPDKKEYAKGLAVKAFPQFVFKKKAENEKAAQAAKEQKAQEPKRKEQEKKEAQARAEFRKNVIMPAIAVAVAAKAKSASLALVTSHGQVVATGEDAEKVSSALSIPLNEVKAGDGTTTKVAYFADKDLQDNLKTLSALNIDIDVVDEKGEIKETVRETKAESEGVTQTTTETKEVDEETGETISQGITTNEEVDDEEEYEEEETQSRGFSR